MRTARIVPLLVIAVFAVGAVIYSENLKSRAQVGAPIPTFALQDLSGATWQVDRSTDVPVIVNFWATWCEPCLLEMPAHEAFWRRYGDRVRYFGVNEREPPIRIQEHLAREASKGVEFTFPILLDRNGAVGETFRIGGMPETWFTGADGTARFHWLGPVTFEMLQAAYAEAVGSPIDAADGGPFHRGGTARAVLVGESPRVVYVGGTGGFARYELSEGSADAAAFVWQPVDGDVVALRRGGDGEPVAVSGSGWPGLPATPGALAGGHGYQLAWVAGYGLYRSDGEPGAQGSGQAAWTRVEPGVGPAERVLALAADPLVADRWLAATAAGLMESRDGGQTWRSLDVEPRVYGLAFDPGTPRRVYLATDMGVWVSEEGGRRPARVAASPQRVLVSLDAVTLPEGGTWLVAVAPNGDVYGSLGGAAWSLLVPRPAQPGGDRA